MLVTIFFYVSVFFLLRYKKEQGLKYSFVLVGLYLGLRYNYMPDYMQYLLYFDRANANGYTFDPDYEHFEVGWYIITRLFKPIGFFGFVAFWSALFAFASYKILKLYSKFNEHQNIVIIYFITSSAFAVLSSAQRQFVVTVIFLLAFRYLLYNNINKIKDLINQKTLLYYGVIYLCTLLHSSSFLLWIVPLFFLIPSGGKKYSIALLILFGAFLALGSVYLPMWMDMFVKQSDMYSYMKGIDAELIEIPILGGIMNTINIITMAFVITIKKMDRNESALFAISIFSLFLGMSGYFTAQVSRYSLYFLTFSSLGYGLILHSLPRNFSIIYKNILVVWIVWNLFKWVTTPIMKDYDEYHTIFTALLQ